jgi:hypothetical protein
METLRTAYEKKAKVDDLGIMSRVVGLRDKALPAQQLARAVERLLVAVAI